MRLLSETSFSEPLIVNPTAMVLIFSETLSNMEVRMKQHKSWWSKNRELHVGQHSLMNCQNFSECKHLTTVYANLTYKFVIFTDGK